jgi:spermidine synthase
MTDTPAEASDLFGVDLAMSEVPGGSMLIVGLGLGMVLHRAITHRGMEWIDVVEREDRVVRAVGPYYEALAARHGTKLTIHQADIHEWKRPRNAWWDLGWFDIWADIDMDDRAEVKLLRDRFRRHLGWFGAWAQWERNQQARRIRTKTGLY